MDTAKYAHYQLRNGLSVVVASDLELQREAACMAVAVGQMSDPPGWEGLAHFTEHMLFLGSSQFPDEAEYKKYLSANGGSSNAATGTDYTYYWFDVRAGVRCSRLLALPNLSPDPETSRQTRGCAGALRRVFSLSALRRVLDPPRDGGDRQRAQQKPAVRLPENVPSAEEPL